MVKPVVLSGGAEFAEESKELDKAMLRQVRERRPHVVIVPAAASANPRRTVKTGERYFDSLGARTESAMVVDAATADPGGQAASIEQASVIYLSDGGPLDAVNALKGSDALGKIRRAWHAGAILAGCGAGAMALCDVYWDSGQWEPGLGLLAGIVVLPHHQVLSGRFSGERLRQNLPAGLVIVGLDDATGVLLNGPAGRVVGPGLVTLYQGEHETEYTDGQTFTLPGSVITPEV